MSGTTGDPIVTVTCWRGPLSALAARLKMPPALLLFRIRARGQKRGAGSWEIQISSPTAMMSLARVLNGEATE